MSNMKNVVLIGMPGCGKSTLGVLLAKELGLSFVDTDIVIQSRTGELLQETLSKKGVEGLLYEEEQAILSMDLSKPCVIATGGSAVLRENSMKHLTQNGVCVYLYLTCGEIESRINNRQTRGIAANPDETLQDIFDYRTPFYEKYASITIDCNNSGIEENVSLIKAALSEHFS